MIDHTTDEDFALSGGESTYCDKCESVECGCGDVQRECHDGKGE